MEENIMKPINEALFKQFQETLGLKESPLGIYYTNDKPEGVTSKAGIEACMIGLLQNARKKGETVYFDKEHFGCPGGAYYMGFLESPRPNLEFFLSCGIPGKLEGEHYKKSPALVREAMKYSPVFKAQVVSSSSKDGISLRSGTIPM
jgi:uncharacterized protein (DUF169 family)